MNIPIIIQSWDSEIEELQQLLATIPDHYTDDELTVDDITEMTASTDELNISESETT